MAIYRFHCVDGARDYDKTGTELPDDAAAQLAAVEYSADVLKHRPGTLWEKGQWRVEVCDQDDALLFTVITIAVDTPHAEERRNRSSHQP